MRLSKVLLAAGVGVLVYKALKSINIVKLEVPREVAELDLFVGDISKAMFDYSEDIEAGEDKEKAIEKFKKTLGVTEVEVTDEAINLHFENAKDKVDAAIEKKVSEVQEATDEAKKLINEYHENYKEVTV